MKHIRIKIIDTLKKFDTNIPYHVGDNMRKIFVLNILNISSNCKQQLTKN